MSRGNHRIERLYKYFYQIIFLVLLLDRMDNLPSGIFSILRKLKYVYLAIVALYLITDKKVFLIKRKVISVAIVIFIFILHTCLFGIVFVNDQVIRDTRFHFRELLLLLLFIIGTVHLYRANGLVQEFAKHTYNCYLITLIWAGITHISNFVNPIKFIYVLEGNHAYRVSFGLGHANYVGSICCCALICSIYIIENIRNHCTFRRLLHKKKVWIIVLADIYICEMLFSTASRTAIIAFVCAIGIYLVILGNELFPQFGVKRARIIIIASGCLILFILFTQGIFQELLSTSHRDSLVATNMSILTNYYSVWTGMGYINYSRFGYGNWALGYQTVNVDSYYAYIFFSSGVIGLIMIIIALSIMAIRVLKVSYIKKNISGVLTMVSFLLLGIAQASILSYDHLISYTYWILIFLTMVGADKSKLSKRPGRIAIVEQS